MKCYPLISKDICLMLFHNVGCGVCNTSVLLSVKDNYKNMIITGGEDLKYYHMYYFIFTFFYKEVVS